MNGYSRLSILVVTVALFAPSMCEAQFNFSGKWALNSAASDLGGSGPPPKSDVITIRHRGKAFAWSEVAVMPNGSVDKESWSGAMDGIARPVKGPPGTLASYKPDSSGRWMSPEGNSDLMAAVSADGKQFFITSTMKSPEGQITKLRFVYDRVN